MFPKIGKKGLKDESGGMSFVIFQKGFKTGGAEEENLTAACLFYFLNVLFDSLRIWTRSRISLHSLTADLIDHCEIDAQPPEKFNHSHCRFRLCRQSHTADI